MAADPPGRRRLLVEGTDPQTLPRNEVPDGSEWTGVPVSDRTEYEQLPIDEE